MNRYRDYGPVYWNRALYRLAMGLLRPGGRDDIWRPIEAQHSDGPVPDPSSVPAELLRWISGPYRDIYINPAFAGAGVTLAEVLTAEWPAADYVVMSDSLYHFLPDVGPLLRRMTEHAGKKVVISEPVENIASRTSPWMRALARCATRV